MSLVTLDPTGTTTDTGQDRRGERRLAPRPASLTGARVGLVANGLGAGEAFLDALVEELAATDELAGVVKVVKSSVSIPPDPGDWSRLTQGATVAITGFGG
jgi:hypothetical protein